MKNIKLYLIIILSFMFGTLVSQFPIFVYAVNCNNIPTFHIIYLRQIKECLESTDKELDNELDMTNSRIDNSNLLFFNELDRLETKIDSLNGTLPK